MGTKASTHLDGSDNATGCSTSSPLMEEKKDQKDAKSTESGLVMKKKEKKDEPKFPAASSSEGKYPTSSNKKGGDERHTAKGKGLMVKYRPLPQDDEEEDQTPKWK